MSPGLAVAYLARSSVRSFTGLPPQFCVSVRGITSRARAICSYGKASLPGMVLAFSARATLAETSTAPPPVTRRESKYTLRVTARASCRLRSTSFSTSLLAPRRTMVQALGSLQSVMYE
eukprot:Mycagemm_TRINITY_DN9093_c0_g1::TRINITY_DN9093_c0_g1_i1::g.5399::m.5399 type:complete len:119 gc:universal TRINITY_DN9093_c0_g1_i1:601-245(-)